MFIHIIKPVWDKYTEERIRHLHPVIRDKVRHIINGLERQGYQVRVPWRGGYRSFSEQSALYNSGTEVTRAKPGQSFHNYGLAVDIAVIRPCNKSFCLPDAVVVESFKRSGFSWGGDWRIFKDPVHFQYDYGGRLTWRDLYNRYMSGRVDSEGYVKL